MRGLIRLLWALFVLAVYVGAGALTHACLIGGTLDLTSAWAWGLLFAWPLALCAAVLGFGLCAAIAVCIVMGICHLADGIARARRRPA